MELCKKKDQRDSLGRSGETCCGSCLAVPGEKCYRLAATRGTSEFYGSTARRGVEPFKIRIHSCLEHVSAIPEAELMSAGVLARDFSAWSCGTSCGAASASGIAQGCARQLWKRILMVFPPRLAVSHVLDVVFVRGLTACPRSTMRTRESDT